MQQAWLKKILAYRWAAIAIALAVGLSAFARSQMHHFSIDRIVSPLPKHPEWGCENPAQIDAILKQPFHFFACGGQSWSFLSHDGKWVIKFFDFRPTWYDLGKRLHLPDSLLPSLTPKQTRRREGPPSGYAIAAKNFKNECGLEGVFLNGKDVGVRYLEITSPVHCKHQIDLASTSFVIQKKAETLTARLGRYLKNKETNNATKALSQALSLIAARTTAGIADGDNTQLHHNLGFVDEEAIYIDAGTFKECPEFLLTEKAEAEVLRSIDVLLAKLAEENFLR